jgi:hypothetical protein
MVDADKIVNIFGRKTGNPLMWSLEVLQNVAHISYKILCCIPSEMHTGDSKNR